MPSDKFKQAFGRGEAGIESDLDQRNAEALEMLKNIPGQLFNSVKGLISSDQQPNLSESQTNPVLGSYFGPSKQGDLGEADAQGMTTEEIQKLQEAQKQQEKAKAYLEMQQKLKEPPMEVPKSRPNQGFLPPEQAAAIDPRLSNPENLKKFEELVQAVRTRKK